MKETSSPKWLIYLLIGLGFVITYLFLQVNGVLDSLSQSTSPGSSNLVAVFLVGLLAGGLTCMAVQGGLLAATIASREEEKLKEKTKSSHNALPIISFLVSKLVAYTIFGFLLGLFGSLFQLSPVAQGIMQIAIAIIMIGTALAILDVHPIFRYFIIQPPKFLTRLVRKQSKSKDIYAPAILGAMTVFIPCGVTQGMILLAIGSANPFMGAAILFAFVLGTSPVFFVLGYLTTQLGEALKEKFMKVVSVAIILLAVYNLNNALALVGSPLTFESLLPKKSTDSNQYKMAAPVSEATITINSRGYTPGELTIKKGSQVTLHLTNSDGAGCQQAFTIPSIGFQKVIPVGATETITFKAPEKPGVVPFMCSMGMYRGVINVI